MRTLATLVRREVGAYFLSPMAYIFLFSFLLMQGWHFVTLADLFASYPTSQAVLFEFFMWGFTPFYLFIVVPCITMRLLAEERRSGTFEVLMAAPVTDTQVVLSKFLGAFAFYLLLWLPTLAYVWLLAAYASPNYWQIAASYLGVIGFGAVLIAMGLFCSSVTQSQIVSAVLAIAINFSLFFLLYQKENPQLRWMKEPVSLGRWSFTPEAILNHVDFLSHGKDDFARGLIDSRHLVFDLSVVVFFLFLAVKATEFRRWRA